jgi:hypothetical protein
MPARWGSLGWLDVWFLSIGELIAVWLAVAGRPVARFAEARRAACSGSRKRPA